MKTLSLAIAVAGMLIGAATTQGQQTASPVSVEDGVAKISAANTAIQFVGTHVGDEPKPRLGGFKKFEGAIAVNSDNNAITSIKLEISIDSIWTQFDNLTTHLKNADFFNVQEYGQASFESTGIEEDQLGQTMVVGNLTLHGTTKEIRFPIDAKISDEGVIVRSEFKINRALFGMDKMTSGVEKVVSLKFVVGQKTVVVAEGDENPLDAVDESPETPEEELTDPVTMVLKLPHML